MMPHVMRCELTELTAKETIVLRHLAAQCVTEAFVYQIPVPYCGNHHDRSKTTMHAL